MIDLHAHILPGLDDGPKTERESAEMAYAAVAAGIMTIVATPHVSWDYPNRADSIAMAAERLRASLIGRGAELDVKTGAEIAASTVLDLSADELARLTIGGGCWLLLEPPRGPVIMDLERIVGELARRGFRVVLAHPERSWAFHRDRRILERLVDAKVLMSVTAASLSGRFGSAVRSFALDLVRDGLVHNVASDAHDIRRRPPTIGAHLEHAGLAAWTPWLTQVVPGAILAGDEIPQREGSSRVSERPRLRLRGR